MQNVVMRTISLSNRFELIVVQYVSLDVTSSPYFMSIGKCALIPMKNTYYFHVNITRSQQQIDHLNEKPLTVVVDTTRDLRPEHVRILEGRWRRVQFIEHNIIITQNDVALRNNIQQENIFLSTLHRKSLVRRGGSTSTLRLYIYQAMREKKRKKSVDDVHAGCVRCNLKVVQVHVLCIGME